MSLIQRLDPDNVDLTVVSPRSFFFYTPLLPGCSTGTVTYTSLTESIRWYLAPFVNLQGTGTFLQAHATDVDFANKKVTCVSSGGYHGTKDGSAVTELDYDHLVVSVGASANTFGIKGVEENALMMKEVEDALKIQRAVLERLEYANALRLADAPQAQVEKALNWVVIGGGPTGVELTAEFCDFLHSDIAAYFPECAKLVKVTLVEASDRLLGAFTPTVSDFARDALTKQGAKVLCSTLVTGADERRVSLKDVKAKSTDDVDYGLLVWAGGIGARPITRQLAEKIGHGQIPERGPFRGLQVDGKFRVKGVDGVWALGDCAVGTGCAPTAQAAFQQGNYLGRMLRETRFDAGEVEAYAPFKFVNYGSLAYVGSSQGVADLKVKLWDQVSARSDQTAGGAPDEATVVSGAAGYAIWRSLYFSKLLSARNRFQVAFDWTNRAIFGREISTPFNQASLEGLSDKK